MSTTFQRLRRRLSAVTAAGALTAGALAMATAPAQAASVTTTAGDQAITGASLTWSLSNEQGGGAFFGGCNFLSAGKAGNTGSSRLWTEADGFYKTTDGNVTVEKPNASDQYVAPTWATKCQDKNGTAVSSGSTSSTSGNRVRIGAGVGSLDTATGAGSIQWTGSFTSAFYGGLTYWSATNPKLTVNADGTGTLTATASGYGTDMNDTSLWTTIPNTTITLADFKNVDLDQDGFTATPTYLGTAVTVSAGTSQAPKTVANEAIWGSFPQSYVDFQVKTGQSSYWYTSGGSRDAAKPATPVGVSYAALPAATVTVSETTFNHDDSTQEVTVTGKNFNPTLAIGTRPPFQGSQSGVYIAFGRYADNWRPSQGGSGRNNPSGANGNGAAVKWAVPAASFPGPFAQDPTSAAYTELKTDGTFSTKIQVNKSWLASVTGNFGIYTYAGGGPNVAAYETGTPISFKKDAIVGLNASSYSGTAGTPVVVKADASLLAGDAATGSVELVTTPTGGAPTVVDTETLDANGQVTLEVPADAGFAGTLKAVYRGNDTTFSSESESVPLTVEKRESALKLDKSVYSTAFGTALPVTLTVADGEDDATGSVSLSYYSSTDLPANATTIATKDLADGEASFEVPATLDAGKYRLLAVYDGTAAVKRSSSTVTLNVAPGATTTTLASVATHSYGNQVTLAATVTGAPAGSVSFHEGETKLGSGDLSGGKASLKLPADLAVGSHTVTASFDGSANAGGSTSTAVTFTVKAVSTTTAASVTTKPTTTKAGKIRVAVRPTVGEQTPTGTVAVVVAKGSKTYTVKGTLNANGAVNIALPKVSAAGTWRVSARYGTSTSFVGSFKSYFITFAK